MLNKIIEFSIRQKLVVGLLVLFVIIVGVVELNKLPIDAVPDITDNQVQVITVSPSLGAPDIERLITIPVEQGCRSIPHIKQVRSFSRFGLSLVTIVFDDEADLYWARQQVNEKLQAVAGELPTGIGAPELAPVTTGLGEIYQYVLRPKPGYEHKYGPTELRTLQDWIVRRQLLGTPGVADVSSFGGKLKQYEVAVHQDKLKGFGLSITDLYDALEKNNQNTGGAYIEKGPTVLYIRSEGLTSSLDDIGKIVVRNLSNGTPVLIRDVADVQYGHATRYGVMTYNDQGEVAGAVVMMLKGENSSAVVKRVKSKISEIQKMLPEGVVLEAFLDRTKMVDNAIKTVETNLLEGALIVILVLVFFLGNVRAGLIVSSVIPLSMLFAVILMNRFGVGGNLMSLGAIDFGLIVDGSVIVVEVILHTLAHSERFKNVSLLSQEEMDKEVGRSTNRMIKSAVFSQIIILIVYLPILSLQGIEGKMFQPMAYTIAFAILGAFLLSITYVPMMCALVLSKKINHKDTASDKLSKWLERMYVPALQKVVGVPKTVLAITVGFFGMAVVLLMGMGGEFLPEIEEGDFAVETRLLTGSNLTNTLKSTQQAAGLLLKNYAEVEKVVTKIGTAEIPTDPMPFEAGDMIVVLKDKKEWTSAKTFDELSSKMTKTLEAVPGITVGFQYPVQMRFNELMTGARQDVVCKIYGEDLDTLRKYAQQLGKIVNSIDGTTALYEETVTGMPQVVIKYDRDAMAKYGLNIADINRTVNTAFAGQAAGLVYEGERRFDLVVRLAGEHRKNTADISNLLVSTAQGTQIALYNVATITEEEGVNQVQRENGRRRIIVGFNIDGRDVQGVVEELQQKVTKGLALPKEYSIVYGGAFENMNAAKDRLMVVVPVALLLIFVLLYFAFGSVSQGLIIYTAIPLSAVGGVLALWVRDMPFSISAGVGFIALFGVAVLNGILLVSEFNKLEKEGMSNVTERVLLGARTRLRALLMTAVVPAMGFIPMAISTGAGGAVQKPLATVVIGGLLFSTVLTLFVLPVFYLLFSVGMKYVRQGAIVGMLCVAMVNMVPMGAHAQQPMALETAIDLALKQNMALKAARSENKYYAELRKTATDIEQTQLLFEYGRFNSIMLDNKVSASQSFDFPTVYKRQRQVYNSMYGMSLLDTRQQEIALTAAVKKLYYELLVMRKRRVLLQYADSIYKDCATKQAHRLQAGDADVLELTAAQNQQLQLNAQLTALEADYGVLQNELQLLTNSSLPVVPTDMNPTYTLQQLPDTAEVHKTPGLQLYEQRTTTAKLTQQLEQARMLPTLSGGMGSATITGWQPTGSGEKYYGYDMRFNSVIVGLGVPIFYGAQRAKVRASGAIAEQRGTEQAWAHQQASAKVRQALSIYKQRQEMTSKYEATLLPNANKIIEAANKKRALGAIDYINWAILVNQAIAAQSDYLTAVQQQNEAAIALEQLTTTK